jgi:hypothetical protein
MSLQANQTSPNSNPRGYYSTTAALGKTDYERRREQSKMIQNINEDLFSQTKKMQYLSNDLQEINQKIKRTRKVAEELQKVETENFQLREELKSLTEINCRIKADSIEQAKLAEIQKAEIEELKFLLRNEKIQSRDSNQSLKELTLRVKEFKEDERLKMGRLAEENADLNRQLKRLMTLNIELEEDNKKFKYDFERMKNLSIDLQGQNEKLLKIKVNAETESKEFYGEYLQFKGLYEEEKAKNNLNVRSVQENLDLLRVINRDYERCLKKLQDLEQHCEQLTKENNTLRDELQYRV